MNRLTDKDIVTIISELYEPIEICQIIRNDPHDTICRESIKVAIKRVDNYYVEKGEPVKTYIIVRLTKDGNYIDDYTRKEKWLMFLKAKRIIDDINIYKEPVIDCFDDRFDFLSNFYENPVTYNGIMYKTNEAAFQAQKTLNEEERKEIAKLDTPGKAKRAGRKVKLRDDWDIVKNKVMYDVCKEKFSNSKELKDKLLQTYPMRLVEGNTWHDNYWGDCSCSKCIDKHGFNRLGNILMRIREELMKEKM